MTSRRLALPAVLTALLLAGCSPSAPVDFDGVLGAADAPPGMTWTAGEAELTAGEDFETLEHQWADNAGGPDECFPFYLLQYGVMTGDDGVSDRTVEVGFFTHESIEGSILVNAREFPSDQAATDYVSHALEAANACGGYEIGGAPVASEGIAVARLEGGHGLSLDGGTEIDGVSSRTAVVRTGRTIVVVDAFLVEADTVDLGVVDELAATIVRRLDD